MQLSKQIVSSIPAWDRFLCLYPPENHFIRAVSRDGNAFRFLCDRFSHPLQQPQPKHLTREHVVVFVTQILCVACGMLADDQDNLRYDATQYLSALISERATIRSLEFKFQRQVQLSEEIDISLTVKKISHLEAAELLDFSFRFKSGIFGFVRTAVLLR